MERHKTPELSKALFERIKIVRRDIKNMCFHFTRAPEEKFITFEAPFGGTISIQGSASAILHKILYEGKLIGTSKWTYDENCVCFTEAPIQEFNSIFSLIEIASSKEERPRYEPHGIAVSKKWLFSKGGRPVIYDDPLKFDEFPEHLRYRFVPYDPLKGIDFTREREWRIKTDLLELDHKETLVVVPTSEEAFGITYEFANIEADWDDEQPIGAYHVPKWIAVSLDLFGYNC